MIGYFHFSKIAIYRIEFIEDKYIFFIAKQEARSVQFWIITNCGAIDMHK